MEIGKPPPSSARNRREFIANLAMVAGATLGAGGLAFRFAQFLYPVIPPAKWVQTPAGRLSDIPENGVRMVNLPAGPVMLKKTGQTVRALSAICTHLGCIVQWRADANRFVCPCHGGNYDIDGKVLSGPPPRPLNKLEVVLKNDQVFVVMQEPVKEEA